MTLAECKKKHGLTLAQIALIADCSPSMICQFLSGKKTLSPKRGEMLVRYFGKDLTYDDLYGQEK